MKIKHKFHAKPKVCDGIRFASKKEARYYENLKLRIKSGEILFCLLQVPIRLPGGVVYRVDFQEFHSNGDVVFTDVKGYKTPEYKIKKRQIEDLYPFKINEV